MLKAVTQHSPVPAMNHSQQNTPKADQFCKSKANVNTGKPT